MDGRVTATWRQRGNRFQVIVRRDRQQVSGLGRTFKTKREAADYCVEINAADATGLQIKRPVVRALPTMREALPRFIEGLVKRGEIRGSTASGYIERLERWAYPFAGLDSSWPKPFGDLPYDELTRQHLIELVKSIREAGKSGAVLSQVLGPVRAYYDELLDEEKVKASPATNLKRAIGKRREVKAKVEPWDEVQMRAITSTCYKLRPRWGAMTLLLFGTGTRYSEAAALFKTDVDWTRGRLYVGRTWSRERYAGADGKRHSTWVLKEPKQGRDRWVTLQGSALQALRLQIEAMDAEADAKGWSAEQRRFIFRNSAGNTMHEQNYLTEVWQVVLKAAGLDYRKPHTTRHSFATWHLERGADPRWVQQQLGHATLEETTGTYGAWLGGKHDLAAREQDWLALPAGGAR